MVNAQDAMGEKQGKIKLETCRVWMEGENIRLFPGMVKGEYILLSFSDNGCGMPQEVLEHAFEPFFTTKPAGHGTGLGLATVYGIVKQHNAFIGATSRMGEGTTFNIYFPAVTSEKDSALHEHQLPEGKRLGEGTVLLVEDNEMAKDMVDEMLTKMGYSVISSTDPQSALHLMEHDHPPIDLLISDVVMPGMSGTELYEKLLVMLPELSVIFISGYPINPSHRGGTMENEINYLQKPFTAEALMERIRQVM
jgi:CheY-like chemotaxis protein